MCPCVFGHIHIIFKNSAHVYSNRRKLFTLEILIATLLRSEYKRHKTFNDNSVGQIVGKTVTILGNKYSKGNFNNEQINM